MLIVLPKNYYGRCLVLHLFMLLFCIPHDLTSLVDSASNTLPQPYRRNIITRGYQSKFVRKFSNTTSIHLVITCVKEAK